MSPTPESRFQNIVLLHDRGDSPEGHAGALAHILGEIHPTAHFLRPSVPMYLPSAEANFNLAVTKLLPMFHPNALIVGMGISGLFAAALQERFSPLNLSVFAINAPPAQDALAIAHDTGPTMQAERVALYSSQYEPIRGNAESWPNFAEYAFDVPWLANGVDKAMYATSYLISVFMRGLDMRKEVATISPLKDQAKSVEASI